MGEYWKSFVFAFLLALSINTDASSEMIERACFGSKLVRDDRLPAQVISDSENHKCLFWVTPPRQMASADPTYQANEILGSAAKLGPGEERDAQVAKEFTPALLRSLESALNDKFLDSANARSLYAKLLEGSEAVSLCTLEALNSGFSKGAAGPISYYCEFRGGENRSFDLTLYFASVEVSFSSGQI